MASLLKIYPFRVSRRTILRVGKKRYPLGRGGARALRLLAELAQAAANPGDIAWLLPYRDRIREVIRANPSVALTYVIDQTDNQRLRVLAIWLRGRCGGSLGTAMVHQFATSPDRLLRKESVRCLKRLGAWGELLEIAEADPDPRIRRMATQFPTQPFPKRLAEYSQHVEQRPVARRPINRSKRQLFLSPGLDYSQVHGPKPTWFIRRILIRIRRLLSGATH